MNHQFIQKITIDWDYIPMHSHIRRIPSLKQMNELEFTHPVTFFVGENGSGKTTLLEAIAIASGFSSEGGTKNYNFSTYGAHSSLHEAIQISKGYKKAKWGYFLRAESFYNVATKEVEYNALGSYRYHEQSHGESFLAVLQHNLSNEGIYFFDEPEAALSPQRQLTLLMEIYESAKNGAQFIIATHSPILLGLPGAQILSFDGNEIHEIGYEETESYRITEMFVNNKDYLLKKLLEE